MHAELKREICYVSVSTIVVVVTVSTVIVTKIVEREKVKI